MSATASQRTSRKADRSRRSPEDGLVCVHHILRPAKRPGTHSPHKKVLFISFNVVAVARQFSWLGHSSRASWSRADRCSQTCLGQTGLQRSGNIKTGHCSSRSESHQPMTAEWMLLRTSRAGLAGRAGCGGAGPAAAAPVPVVAEVLVQQALQLPHQLPHQRSHLPLQREALLSRTLLDF